MSDFPRMIYRAGGTEEIHGGRFTTLIVDEQDALEAALANGWHLTTDEARDAPERERLAREAEAARVEEERAHAAEAEARAQVEREATAAREEAEQAERDRIAAEERAAAEAEAAAANAEAAAKTEQAQKDNAAPTRAELEQKANELGVEFSPRLGDAKLAERIEAALAAKA